MLVQSTRSIPFYKPCMRKARDRVIKGFALACLCFAQDCHPLGNQGHLGGQLCALRMHASAKRLIVSLWETMAEVSMRSQAVQAARAAYGLKL